MARPERLRTKAAERRLSMAKDPSTDELLKLLSDSREYAKYLAELGVENVALTTERPVAEAPRMVAANIPFVGRAGQLLTKIIEAIGLKREEVLIGNVNRCRPPGNRQPTLEEAAVCRPFLFREISAVQPDVIVVLGNTALRNLLETREGITRVRGKFQDFRGIKVMPTFHPAYLLRDPSKKRETWEDLKKVRDYLDGLRQSQS